MTSKYVPVTVIARQYTSGGQNWPLSAVFGNAVALEAKSLAAAAALNRNNLRANDSGRAALVVVITAACVARLYLGQLLLPFL